MKIGNSVAFDVVLVGLLCALVFRGAWSSARPSEVTRPVLVNTCLITGRFAELVDFYQHALGVSPQSVTNGVYAEFPTGRGVLAIFSGEAQEKYIPGAAEPANNRSAILEFRVTNVDAEYVRLQRFVETWVKPPTNQPWGTRSLYFRDPDGNLVDFYSPAKPR
jgi:catechol 2,3-dioxygenase-like lactoylglutathione lyase family enzyme